MAPDPAARAAGGAVVDPGLETLLGALERASIEFEAALEAAADARASLARLTRTGADGDREMTAFQRDLLAPVHQHLLDVLAGLSEEARRVDWTRRELVVAHAAQTHDPAQALERVAEMTAQFRSMPVATMPSIAARASAGAPGVEARILPGLGGIPLALEGAASRLSDVLRRTGARVSAATSARVAHPEPGDTESPQGGTAAADHAATQLAFDHAPAPARETGEGRGISGSPFRLPVRSEGTPLDAGTQPEARSAPAPSIQLPQSAVAPRASDEPWDEDDGSSDEAIPAGGADEPVGAGTGAAGLVAAAASSPYGKRVARIGVGLVVSALILTSAGGAAGVPVSASAGDPATAAPSSSVDLAQATSGSGTGDAGDTELAAGRTAAGSLSVPAGDDATPPPAAGSQAPSLAPVAAAPGTSVLPVVVSKGSSTGSVVALTFDDGYAPANIRAIVDILRRENVPATFFINGLYLSRAPELWREIAADGYPVGNHTYHHLDIRTLSKAELEKELSMTASAWRRVTGSRLIPYFRPPYGAHDAASDATVAAAGYPNIVMWDTSAADTVRGVSAAHATAGALRGTAGSIVLMHAGPDITPQILPAVIAGYRARGFAFVTVPQLLGNE